MARCVWALIDEDIIEHMSSTAEGNAREWLARMVSTLKHEDLTHVLVTLWAIWHARRKAIHEQQYQSPLSVHHFVQCFISDLQLSEAKGKRELRPEGSCTAPR
jgi:hypothetical protein